MMHPRGRSSFSFCLITTLTLLGAVLAIGCGGRRLQSVAIQPAAADAKDFPNGQVQFSATGTFNDPPSPTPLTANDVQWCTGDSSGMCAGFVITGATLDQNGLAQCRSGFTGTVTILAGKPSSKMMLPDTGSQLKIFGAAQLTCP